MKPSRPAVGRTASVRFDEEAEVCALRDDTHPGPQDSVLPKVVESPSDRNDHYRARFFDSRNIANALPPRRDFEQEEEEDVVSRQALEQRIVMMRRLHWLKRARSHLKTERQLKFFFSALDNNEKGVLTTRDLTEPLMSLNLAKSITDVRNLACNVEGGLTFQNFMRCVMKKDSSWGGLVKAMGVVSPHLSLKTSYLERRRSTMMSALLGKNERDLKILRGWAAQSEFFNFQASSSTLPYRRRSSHACSYNNSEGIIQLVPKSKHLCVTEHDASRVVFSPRNEDDDNASITSSMNSCNSRASSGGSAGRPVRSVGPRSKPNLMRLVSKLDNGNGWTDTSPSTLRRSRTSSFLYTSKQQCEHLSLVDSAHYMFSRFDLITSMLNILIPHLSVRKNCIDARVLDQAMRLVIDEDSATDETGNVTVKLASVKMLWPFLDNGHCGCLSLELLRERLEVLTGGDATATTQPRDLTMSPQLQSPDLNSRVSCQVSPLLAKPVLRKARTDGCIGYVASSAPSSPKGDGSRERLRSVCESQHRPKSSISSIAMSLMQAARLGSQAGHGRQPSAVLSGLTGADSGRARRSNVVPQQSKKGPTFVRTAMAGFADRLERLMKNEGKWLGAVPTGVKVAPPSLVASKQFKRKRPLRPTSTLAQACRQFWEQAYETTIC